MSGHSKWNNIKRKKEKTDGARAKVFTKIGREISVAVRDGGPIPASNSKLADLIAKAKRMSVPNDNIQRIIKKAEGGDKTEFEAITYEGYGPGGVAVMVETLTDNRNRTAADLRHYFDKNGGNLGAMGCVAFLFSQKGGDTKKIPGERQRLVVLRRTVNPFPRGKHWRFNSSFAHFGVMSRESNLARKNQYQEPVYACAVNCLSVKRNAPLFD